MKKNVYSSQKTYGHEVHVSKVNIRCTYIIKICNILLTSNLKLAFDTMLYW